MKHVMLDLETLGVTPGCAILSLGAVEFDQTGLGETFYKVVGDIRGSVDLGTVRWWLQQSEAARNAVCDKTQMDYHGKVIEGFFDWFRVRGAQYIWCHGAIFDEPILRAAATGTEPPWKFWDVRCTRTLYALSGIHPTRDKDRYHNALEDARAQAEAAVASMHMLGWPQ